MAVISAGCFSAAVLTATLSAPARSSARTSCTLRTPPPAVTGMNTSAEVRCKMPLKLLRPYRLATVSRYKSSSMPAS